MQGGALIRRRGRTVCWSANRLAAALLLGGLVLVVLLVLILCRHCRRKEFPLRKKNAISRSSLNTKVRRSRQGPGQACCTTFVERCHPGTSRLVIKGGEVAHSAENLHKIDEIIPAESSHGGNLFHAVYCPSLHLQRVSHNPCFSSLTLT